MEELMITQGRITANPNHGENIYTDLEVTWRRRRVRDGGRSVYVGL
jgi:hypothetical protein